MHETIELTLVEHSALCEETYQLLLEENRILKQTGQAPDEAFLHRKQSLLPRFDLCQQAMGKADPSEARHFRQSIGKAQQTVMKTLLLDRENEQLLLKCTLAQKPRPLPPVASPSQVQKSYTEAAATTTAASGTGESFWWPVPPA